MELTDKQMEELRLGALTAIDGLWFMAAERKLGFEAALELDLEVWKDYGVVLLRRIARATGLELDPANPPGMAAVNDHHSHHLSHRRHAMLLGDAGRR